MPEPDKVKQGFAIRRLLAFDALDELINCGRALLIEQGLNNGHVLHNQLLLLEMSQPFALRFSLQKQAVLYGILGCEEAAEGFGCHALALDDGLVYCEVEEPADADVFHVTLVRKLHADLHSFVDQHKGRGYSLLLHSHELDRRFCVCSVVTRICHGFGVS